MGAGGGGLRASLIAKLLPGATIRVEVAGQLPADDRQDAIDTITKMIEDTIDTDSWKDNGGSVSSLREFAGLLIVTTTAEDHQKVKAFLDKLREHLGDSPGPMMHR